MPTLHNKLLILHVEQAVRDAVDAGQISWTTLRNAFFHSHKRSNIQPLAPAEQIDLLNEMINKGISKSTHAAAAGLVASQVGQGAGTSSGESGTPSTANVAPSDETVVRSKRKNIGATLIGDAGYFARASARLELAVNESPDPDADDVYGDEIVNRRTNRNMITAAQCIILFLKNNDPAALDEFPILKDALPPLWKSRRQSCRSARRPLPKCSAMASGRRSRRGTASALTSVPSGRRATSPRCRRRSTRSPLPSIRRMTGRSRTRPTRSISR